jgi:glycosyltransferase involved in cell wall biosynthesis
MKIAIIRDTAQYWSSGIWWHRNEIPMRALATRGHGVTQFTMKHKMTDQEMTFPDVVIFGRVYPAIFNPMALMREYKKMGKRVLYDMDDDYWQVAKDNPSQLVSNTMKDQYEGMIKEADALITPSKVLAKKFQKIFKKPVFICPNGIDFKEYQERPHKNQKLVIGYMGAASHWGDLTMIADALIELNRKYDFEFNIYGMTNGAIDNEMCLYEMYLKDNIKPEQNAFFATALNFYDKLKELKGRHIPFFLPKLHPSKLSECDFDIGIAPLEDTIFNNGKSCVKFYEYASVGTLTLASDIEPYKSEVNYRAKATTQDWYRKLEKLIVDKDFREKLTKQQQDWVKQNRSLEAIAIPWEIACQKPLIKGLKILNQQ